jgi:hypothetical protein
LRPSDTRRCCTPGRSTDELVECQRHETLLNLAFAGVPAWWLLCPYDTSALGGPVLEEASRSHPFVSQRGVATASADYRDLVQLLPAGAVVRLHLYVG